MDEKREVPEDVVKKAESVGIEKEQLEDALDLVEPHIRKLPRWVKVLIGISISVALFLLRYYEWL